MTISGVRRTDVLLAALTLVAALVELVLLDHVDHAPVAVATSIVACVALAFRRVAPVAVAVVCTSCQVTNQFAHVNISDLVVPVVWLVVSIYAMARYCSLRRALAGLAAVLALFASTLFVDGSDWFFGGVVGLAPWFVGRAFRASATETDELSVRVEKLQEQREAEVALALADERSRIARDLHDVIAHSVTVMLVQSGAAQEVLATDPASAVEALGTVQQAGRQALTEMSTLLGMLHEENGDVGLNPQPGLEQLESLVQQSSGGGLDVTLTRRGRPYDVSPGVQVSIYRVVQESLTNVRKHSSAGHASVSLTYEPERLVAEICNDGGATGDGQGTQRGIVGMRERVEIYGGALEAGQRPDGGYRVVATIPVGATP